MIFCGYPITRMWGVSNRMAKRKTRRNVEMGFWQDGIFHPIRASADYVRAAAGEGTVYAPRKKKGKKKKNRAHSAKMRFFRPAKRKAKRKNPVRVGAQVVGSGTGWIKAKAVKVRKVKGKGYILDVKR